MERRRVARAGPGTVTVPALGPSSRAHHVPKPFHVPRDRAALTLAISPTGGAAVGGRGGQAPHTQAAAQGWSREQSGPPAPIGSPRAGTGALWT